MLQLFKKAKTEQQIVAEIHNEFDTAEDRLLEQADNLLAELNIPTETSIELKADKLTKLGFVNSEVVLQASGLKEQRSNQQRVLVSTMQQAKLIRYYKQNYPFQKFLTIDELERICEKYNLVFASVNNYIKDVPDKNINEISNAPSLKIGDGVGNLYYFRAHKSNIKDSCPQVVKQHLLNGVLMTNEYSWSVEDSLRKLYGIEKEKCIKSPSFDHDIVTEDKSGLFIAAPQSHFNLKGLTKKGKFSFLSVTVTEVKDPIVFRHVRGGIQVLSKWGLEAEDESLVNEKLN
jgi:hypothetical protein